MSTTPWPDMDIDRKACAQALDEMGDEAPLTKVLQRAQEIKDQMKTAGSDWFRFLNEDRPDEFDHDSIAEDMRED